MQKMNKKGIVLPTILVVAVLAILVIAGISQGWFTNILPMKGEKAQIAGGKVDKSAPQGCSGVQSVNLLYNDKNSYKTGTDPATNLTIRVPIKLQIVDDATSTTGPVRSSFKALAGNSEGDHSTTYYAKEVSFDTVCSDINIQTELDQADTSPTITAVQDDGITKFSSSASETVAASSTYNVEYTIKSSAEKCAAVQGAVFACEYDATYLNNIERGSGNIQKKNYAVYFSHATIKNATNDQWQTFLWKDVDGRLCDGDKDTFSLDYTTTTTTPLVDGPSMNCTWVGINKDLDADDFSLLEGIYDEDNNRIGLSVKDTRTYTTP